MTSDLAAHLRELADGACHDGDARSAYLLLDSSWLVETGADPASVLDTLAPYCLPEPYERRVAERIAEIDHAAPAAPAPARPHPPVEAAPEPSFASIWVSPRSAHLHDTEDP